MWNQCIPPSKSSLFGDLYMIALSVWIIILKQVIMWFLLVIMEKIILKQVNSNLRLSFHIDHEEITLLIKIMDSSLSQPFKTAIQ